MLQRHGGHVDPQIDLTLTESLPKGYGVVNYDNPTKSARFNEMAARYNRLGERILRDTLEGDEKQCVRTLFAFLHFLAC
jgi:hypothetical protein